MAGHTDPPQRPHQEGRLPHCHRAQRDLRTTRHLGRTLWSKWARDHVRSQVEARMNCLKAFGERIMSRDPDRQAAEIHIRIAIMNIFSTLGRAKIEAVA